MKLNKYFCLLAAGVALTACSNEDTISDKKDAQPTELSGFGGSISTDLDVLASEGCEGAQAAADTRSTLTDGVFKSWNTKDVVSISDGTLFYQYHPSTINGASCEFAVVEGKNQFDKNLTGTENFYVFYPSAAVSGWNGSKVSSKVYAEQDYTENVDNGSMGAYMATKATVSDDSHVSFNFKHCCSVVEVNLASLGVTPKRISLKSNNGIAIAGKISYDIDNQTITVASNDATDCAYSTQSDVVSLNNVAADAQMARFYILPVQLKGGITVTIEDTDGNFYTKKTTTDVGNTTEDFTVKESNNNALVAAKPYYKKVNFGAASTAKKGDWMATIPGNVWLHTLSIPGAHDAATYNITSVLYQSAYTQSLTIEEQLKAGVRAFDLRVPYKGVDSPTTATVNIYHGIVNTKVLFKDAMDYLVSFVKNNPTETVVVVVNKEESGSGTDYSEDTNNCTWQKSIRDYLDGTYTDASTIDATITGSRKDYFITNVDQPMRLNACRGKILFISRNYYGTSQSATTPVYGAVVRTWQENTAFDATLYKNNAANVCGVYVQDYYSISKTADKQNYVADCLSKSAADKTNKFYINFVSMITGTLAYPKAVAKEMNSATATKLASTSGKTGLMFFDFCGNSTYSGDKLLQAVIAQNYKYVFSNRSRISSSSSNNTGANISGDEFADDSEVYAKPFRAY